MQRTKIEWATHTWNPVTGCLGRNNDGKLCPYCYANRIATRFAGMPQYRQGFAPTFHPKRLNEKLPKEPGARIFVGSMTDMGAPWCHEWLMKTLEVARRHPEHTFIYLTKQPEGFATVEWPDNCWVGMTYTGVGVVDYRPLRRTMATTLFVSFEPLLDMPMYPWEPSLRYDAWLNWAIVGAQTGPGAAAPERDWIDYLDRITKQTGAALFMKDNSRPYWDGEWRQEYPRAKGGNGGQETIQAGKASVQDGGAQPAGRAESGEPSA